MLWLRAARQPTSRAQGSACWSGTNHAASPLGSETYPGTTSALLVPENFQSNAGLLDKDMPQ